jgi:hypothetical protein
LVRFLACLQDGPVGLIQSHKVRVQYKKPTFCRDHLLLMGGGCSNLWNSSASDRWSSFTRKNSGFKKNKRPTSVVESYKTTYGHKAVVLMSVVEGRAENMCSH